MTKLYTYQDNNLASVLTSPYDPGKDYVYTVAPGAIGNVVYSEVVVKRRRYNNA